MKKYKNEKSLKRYFFGENETIKIGNTIFKADSSDNGQEISLVKGYIDKQQGFVPQYDSVTITR